MNNEAVVAKFTDFAKAYKSFVDAKKTLEFFASEAKKAATRFSDMHDATIRGDMLSYEHGRMVEAEKIFKVAESDFQECRDRFVSAAASFMQGALE